MNKKEEGMKEKHLWKFIGLAGAGYAPEQGWTAFIMRSLALVFHRP